MTTTNLPSALEHPSSRARRVAEAHFTAEAANDLDVVMASMASGDFMTTALVDNMPEGRLLVSCATPAEQRRHYSEVHSRIQVLDADLFTSVGGDWYGFVHGIVHVQVVATGEFRSNEAIGVLPVSADRDVIGGEIGLAYPPDAKRGDQPGQPALERIANLKVHQKWLDALRQADAPRLAACYGNEVLAAARQPDDRPLRPLRGRQAVASHYDQLFSTYQIDSIDVLRRVVDRWFVFTELAWVLRTPDGQRHHHRSANAIVIGLHNEILVDLGYGTDLELA